MGENLFEGAYFLTRLKPDPRKELLWQTLWEFSLSRTLGKPKSVLEVGAGYCELINAVDSPKKFAVDLWPGIHKFADDNVSTHVSSALKMDFLGDESIDLVLASNFFEHLSQPDARTCLEELYRVLSPGGKLCLIQPNFKFSTRHYFDDFTHISIWTHLSLGDFLQSLGWSIEVVVAKYLPLSLKSRFPVSKALIRLYLLSPFKPFAGQMLVVASKPARLDSDQRTP